MEDILAKKSSLKSMVFVFFLTALGIFLRQQKIKFLLLT